MMASSFCLISDPRRKRRKNRPIHPNPSQIEQIISRDDEARDLIGSSTSVQFRLENPLHWEDDTGSVSMSCITCKETPTSKTILQTPSPPQ